jgi:lysophospholipase L1-like esterase
MTGNRTAAIVILAAVLTIGIFVTIGIARNSSDEPTAGVSSTGTGETVAFYGDSYTLGTGASDDGKRWSTIVSEARNWREINPSVNGLGFINNRSTFGAGDLPSMVIDADPDIVFVTMGLNDNFSYDRAAERIRTQITDDFTRLADALPNARFIVVEPFWYTDERPASVGVISGWVRDAADAIDAEYIPGASHWIEGHPEWMASDGLHPNDAGYAAMAERMDAALVELGLPATTR